MYELHKYSTPSGRWIFQTQEQLLDFLKQSIDEDTTDMDLAAVLKTKSGVGYVVYCDGVSYDVTYNSWR